jgi:signal peptidase I
MMRTPGRTAVEWLIGVGIFALVMHTWFVMGLVMPVTVSGHSMAPTLDEPQRMLVDRTAFAFRAPRRWEIVGFRCPHDAREFCVKRVAGLPGERVALVEGLVTIDGAAVAMPPGLRFDRRYEDTADPQTGWQLGPYEYFVLGDNGPISDDSRNWRPSAGLNAKMLLGKPLGVR